MKDEYIMNCDHKSQEDRYNIALFQVFDENDGEVSAKVRYVKIWLSKNAMFGLGTELIRLAHHFEEGNEITIKPTIAKTGLKQVMGIYLTPDSCPLTIKCQSFEPIEKILEKSKKLR
jgi:hypothetical protein